MKKSTMLFGLFLVAQCLPTLNAGAQMRENTPDVLTPQEPQPQVVLPDSQRIIDAYRVSYTRQLMPRIVVFWNRDLTDEVVTQYRNVLKTSSNLSAGASGSADLSGTGHSMSLYENSEAYIDSKVEISVESQRIDPQVRDGLNELLDWEVEGLFKRTLLDGGSRLIDREIIFRTTGKASESNERVNRQQIEIDSLVGKADLLMEVFLAPDPGSASGVAFRVSVTSIENGEILAHLFTPALPPTVTTYSYVATNRGFQKVETESAFETRDIGITLALQTMEELSQRWNALPVPDVKTGD